MIMAGALLLMSYIFCQMFFSWKSTKQHSMSRSSIEAEFRALANAAAEVIWGQNLLHELGILLHCTPLLITDNLSATYVCRTPVLNSHSKHLHWTISLFRSMWLLVLCGLHMSVLLTRLLIC